MKNADLTALSSSPDSFGVPLAIMSNLAPLLASLGFAGGTLVATSAVAAATAWNILHPWGNHDA